MTLGEIEQVIAEIKRDLLVTRDKVKNLQCYYSRLQITVWRKQLGKLNKRLKQHIILRDLNTPHDGQQGVKRC